MVRNYEKLPASNDTTKANIKKRRWSKNKNKRHSNGKVFTKGQTKKKDSMDVLFIDQCQRN